MLKPPGLQKFLRSLRRLRRRRFEFSLQLRRIASPASLGRRQRLTRLPACATTSRASSSDRMRRRRHRPAKRHPLPLQLRNMKTADRIPMHQLRRRARPLLSPTSPRPRLRRQREASRPEVTSAQASTVRHIRYGPAAIIALNISVHDRLPCAGRWARAPCDCFRK